MNTEVQTNEVWKYLGRLDGGDSHKIFKNLKNGMFGIADNSGWFPNETDDGTFYIKVPQELVIDLRNWSRHYSQYFEVISGRDYNKCSQVSTTINGMITLAKIVDLRIRTNHPNVKIEF